MHWVSTIWNRHPEGVRRSVPAPRSATEGPAAWEVPGAFGSAKQVLRFSLARRRGELACSGLRTTIAWFHAVAEFAPSAILTAFIAILVVITPACAHAQFMHEPKEPLTTNTPIPILQQVGIDQHIGQQLPLDLTFRDESGQSVPLRRYFGSRPVLLTLVYYQCSMLCSQVLNGVVSSLLPLKLNVGRDFDVLTVSFDPRDTPALATEKRDTYLRRYGRAGADKGWHFLTGDTPGIEALTKAAGFRYAWDAKIQQYAHASGIMIVTPDGRLSHYLYGIEYAPGDLRLALVQSSEGKLGNVVDQVLLYCYHYDPATGKYGAVVMNMLRLGGGLTLVLLGGFLALAWRRDLRAKASGVVHAWHRNSERAG